MKILILPGILRQIATTVGVWAPIFFIILILSFPMSYADVLYFRLLSTAVLAVFMAMHFWWFIAASDQNIQRERFLVSLPLSRRQVARLGIQMMLVSQLIVIGAALIVSLSSLAANLIDLNQVLIIVAYCVWFPVFTLLAYCVLGYIKFLLMRIAILILSMILAVGPLAVLAEVALHTVQIFVVFTIPAIVAIINLLIIRHSERRFIQMDLL